MPLTIEIGGAFGPSQTKWREKLLLSVANLGNSEQFWKKWDPSLRQRGDKPIEILFMPREQARDAELLQIRDGLRDVWDRKDSSSFILQDWIRWHDERVPAFVTSQEEGVMPNPSNLRLQLVLGICEWGPKLAHCQADGCPAPYFVRHRDERQRFCDREQCLEFGQRLHKREWARRSRHEQKLKETKKAKKKHAH